MLSLAFAFGVISEDERTMTHGIVLRCVVGSQRGEDAVEIIGSEGKVAIGTVDVACPEGSGRIR